MSGMELGLLAGVLLVAGFASGADCRSVGGRRRHYFGAGVVSNLRDFRPADYLQIHMAVGTSLAIICFTGTQSARAHFKRGAVEVEVLKSWGAFIAVGALSGAIAARFIAPAGLKIIFATLALTMAVRMVTSKNGGEAGTASITAGYKKRSPLLSVSFHL